MIQEFLPGNLRDLWRPDENSYGEDNGQVTIVGGSSLFQGAPLMSMVAVSRMVDMVFVATPVEDKEIVSKISLFSKLRAVIWIPKEEVDAYIAKSDAVLVGPGMMRFHRETDRPLGGGKEFDEVGVETKLVTENLLRRHPDKKWVIDGGSLQTMEAKWIPEGAVLTPNRREFEALFGETFSVENLEKHARRQRCVIAYKGPISFVSDGETTFRVEGGNAGLTKGGTGDVLAGVVVGLVAKNPPLLSAAAGIFLVKKTAERLFDKVGHNFNADDLAWEVFETKKLLLGF